MSLLHCCQANMARTSPSRPRSGLGFQVKVLQPLQGDSSGPGRGCLQFMSMPCGRFETLHTPCALQIALFVFVVLIENCAVQRHLIVRHFDGFSVDLGSVAVTLPSQQPLGINLEPRDATTRSKPFNARIATCSATESAEGRSASILKLLALMEAKRTAKHLLQGIPPIIPRAADTLALCYHQILEGRQIVAVESLDLY